MEREKTHTFVCTVNRHQIYWKHNNARYDTSLFVVEKNGIQTYRTEGLYNAVCHALPENQWTRRQRERFIALAKEHDIAEVKYFKE